MSNTPVFAHNPASSPERRQHPRRQVKGLAYLNIGAENGGIVLNLGEEGLALQAVAPLENQTDINLKVQIPDSPTRVKIAARIVWRNQSNRQAGVRFVDMPSEGRAQIEEWVRSQISPSTISEGTPAAAEVVIAQQNKPQAVREPRGDKWRSLMALSGSSVAAKQIPPPIAESPESAAHPPDERKIAAELPAPGLEPPRVGEGSKSPLQVPRKIETPDERKIAAELPAPGVEPPRVSEGSKSPLQVPRKIEATGERKISPELPAPGLEPPLVGEGSKSPLQVPRRIGVPDERKIAAELPAPGVEPQRVDEGSKSLFQVPRKIEATGERKISSELLAPGVEPPLVGEGSKSLFQVPQRIEATGERKISSELLAPGVEPPLVGEGSKSLFQVPRKIEATGDRKISSELLAPGVEPPLVGEGSKSLFQVPRRIEVPLPGAQSQPRPELPGSDSHPDGKSVVPSGSDRAIPITNHLQSADEVAANLRNKISPPAPLPTPKPLTPSASSAPPAPVLNLRPSPAPISATKLPNIPPASARSSVRKWAGMAVLFALFSVLSFIIGRWVGPRNIRVQSAQAPPPVAEAPVSVAEPAPSNGSKANELAPATDSQPRSERHGRNSGAENQKRMPVFPTYPPRVAPALLDTQPAPAIQNLSSKAATKPPESIPPPAPPPVPEETTSAASAPRIVGGRVLKPSDRFNPCHLTYRVEPSYPADAKLQGIEGPVKIHLVIGPDGVVRSMKLLNGSPLLAPAAMDAAKYWQYLPALLNGQPVETEQDVEIDFRLPR